MVTGGVPPVAAEPDRPCGLGGVKVQDADTPSPIEARTTQFLTRHRRLRAGSCERTAASLTPTTRPLC